MRDIRAAARAMHRVLLAHGTATQMVRGLSMSDLGALYNFEWASPIDDNAAALRATQTFDWFYNRFFMGELFKKAYPDSVLVGLEQHLPDGWHNDFYIIAEPLDWVRVNCYIRKVIGPVDGPWPKMEQLPSPLPKAPVDWEVYPDGLHNFIMPTMREHTDNLPLYVTENGMASDDQLVDGAVYDQARLDTLMHISHRSSGQCAKEHL
jgi:beta-glucosidase